MQTPNPEHEPRGWRQKTPNPGLKKEDRGIVMESLVGTNDIIGYQTNCTSTQIDIRFSK